MAKNQVNLIRTLKPPKSFTSRNGRLKGTFYNRGPNHQGFFTPKKKKF